jgi:hypothetical protein
VQGGLGRRARRRAAAPRESRSERQCNDQRSDPRTAPAGMSRSICRNPGAGGCFHAID